MRRLMNDNRIEAIINSDVQTKGLELLENRPTVGSLSESDQFASDEMERFWLNSRNIQESTITGCEVFPGEMLKLTSDKVVMSQPMLNLLVEYYIATYEMYDFKTPFGEGPEDSIVIRVIMNQFGRCRIGSEVFGSAMSSRHVKSSFIMAKFILDDRQVDQYPGQIQYFFTHNVDFPDRTAEHNLAYVRWYRPADTIKTRFYFRVDDDDETCNVELWKPEFYSESRDCIILVHNILCQFIPIKFQISVRSMVAIIYNQQ